MQESRLKFISESLLRWQFKAKGQRPIVPLLLPPTFSFKRLLSLSFTLSSCLFFSFSLITLYLPFSPHRLCLPPPWLSFIGPTPHFRRRAYSGRPLSFQTPSFCRIKALVQNQFPLLSVMFFSLTSIPAFIQVFSSSQVIVLGSKW